jgi:hypothetical protein
MEDILAVYMQPRDPLRPLVCLDESSKQLILETPVPISMKPGQPARSDDEYKRNGTANLFMALRLSKVGATSRLPTGAPLWITPGC